MWDRWEFTETHLVLMNINELRLWSKERTCDKCQRSIGPSSKRPGIWALLGLLNSLFLDGKKTWNNQCLEPNIRFMRWCGRYSHYSLRYPWIMIIMGVCIIYIYIHTHETYLILLWFLSAIWSSDILPPSSADSFRKCSSDLSPTSSCKISWGVARNMDQRTESLNH